MIKLKPGLITLFKKADPQAYTAAVVYGYLPDIYKELGVFTFWTLEFCQQDALKYTRLADWRKANATAANSANKHGWMKECNKHFTDIKEAWTKKKCFEEIIKFSSAKEWRDNSSAHYYARSNGILEECYAHALMFNKSFKIQKQTSWTKQECIDIANKFSSKIEWKKNNRASCEYARRKGWYDECVSHMPPDIGHTKGIHQKYSDEDLFKIALKYKTKCEWDKSDRNSFVRASTRTAFFEMCAHMVPHVREKKKWLTIDSIETDARTFKSFKDWRTKNVSYQAARINGWQHIIKNKIWK